MLKLLEWIIPSLSNYQHNKTVREKIKKEENLDKPSAKISLEQLSEETLEQLYNADKTIKDKLEDKAKTNVIGVTISVTLIMGAYTLLQNISEKYGIGLLYIVAVALFVVAVVYMLAAGIHAIHVLTAENIVHTVSLGLEGDLHKIEIDRQIGLNRARNTVRNNYIFTSYECIRNALICLFVVMVIAIIPLHNHDNGSVSACYNNYYLSTDAMQSVIDGIDLSMVKDYIESQPKRDDVISVVDDIDRLFIKYSIDGDKVIIYLIEPY